MSLPWTAHRISRSVIRLNIDVPSVSDFEMDFMLQSDEHWDNPKCKRKLLRSHLDMALERNAGIIGNGDFFCAMQGKYDPRASKASVRKEHQNDRYIDSLIETAAEWYNPYAKNIISRGTGNHESAVNRRIETDLVGRYAQHQNAISGSNIQAMGYGYWVIFQFRRGKQRQSYAMYLYHGAGGGGGTTRGIGKTVRRAAIYPDADIVMGGHIHEGWSLPMKRFRISKSDKLYQDTQWHITTPTYKDEFADGHGGWAVEKELPPKPLGCYWIRFYWYEGRFHMKPIPEMLDRHNV